MSDIDLTKIDPDVYLRAAELVETGDAWYSYACNAIHYGVGLSVFEDRSQEEDLFSECFRPRGCAGFQPWFGPTEIRRNQQRRVFALLFMHEIAKDLVREAKRRARK